MTTDIEYQLTRDDQLVFLHIPKTAGLTVRSILSNHFGYAERYPRPDEWWSVASESPEALASYRLFSGHYIYSIGELLQRPVYVTMFRHPVDRLVSHFNYIRSNPITAIDKFVAEEGMTLNEFLVNPATATSLRDWQSGFIASVPLAELGAAQERLAELQASLLDPGHSLYPSLGIEIAIERLNSLAMFGICERFEESLLLMDYTFGWRPTRDYQSFNIAPQRSRRETLSSATLDAALALSAEDIVLYEYGEKLFEERFSRMSQTLLERYGTARHARLTLPLGFDELLELMDAHHRHRRPRMEPRDSFEWDPGAAVVGSGWHPAEPDGRGRFGRWTGPGSRSTLDVPLAGGSDYRIEFEANFVTAPELLGGVSLRADGEVIALHSRCSGEVRGGTFKGLIPASIVDSSDGVVTLEWELARTLQPCEINPRNLDPRRLGMFLRRITVLPEIPPDPCDSFEWNPVDSAVGSGWYPPERAGGDRYGRWTGPEAVSTLDVSLVGNIDYRIEFEVRGVVAGELLAGVSLKANGVNVTLARNVGAETRASVFSGVIPRSVVGTPGGIVTLELGLERTMRPCEVKPTNPDSRRLGMFVRGLRISPMILVGPGCSFRWDPADAGVGSGWYPPEPIGGGRYGRWTGPDPVSTFDVALVGSTDYRIEFEVFHVVSAELLESVSLKANGVAVDLSRNFGVETQVNVFSGVIPCSVVGPSGGVVALELGLERTMRPCEVDETNLDPRRLGMLLGGFTIVSCNSSDSSPESTRMESRNPTETMVEAP